MSRKLVQIKSSGADLGTDLKKAFRALQIPPEDLRGSEEQVACFVKDKRYKNFGFRPREGTLVTILLSSSVYQKPFLQIDPQWIAYEDDACVVVDKPEGVSTQATQKWAEDHLYGAMMSYYTRANASQLGYVGLHHRLDRDTSGLVIFTKKRSANKSLSEQFKNRTIHKTYYAVVSGEKPVHPQWEEDGSIQRDYKSKHFRFRVHPEGESALSAFRWLEELPGGLHLIECSPKTGRTHQLRVHLSVSGLPILGDRTYGGLSHARMMLHAREIRFRHPLSNQVIRVESKMQFP